MVIVMKCYQCRIHFYPKRTLQTLLSEPLQLRCDRCDRRYTRYIHKTVLPIEGYLLYHYTLFFENCPIKEEAFLDESLKIIIEYLLNKQENDLILFKDELDLALFEALEQLNLSNIYLICLFPSKLMI
jgi:hypothetical protein